MPNRPWKVLYIRSITSLRAHKLWLINMDIQPKLTSIAQSDETNWLLFIFAFFNIIPPYNFIHQNTFDQIWNYEIAKCVSVFSFCWFISLLQHRLVSLWWGAPVRLNEAQIQLEHMLHMRDGLQCRNWSCSVAYYPSSTCVCVCEWIQLYCFYYRFR